MLNRRSLRAFALALLVVFAGAPAHPRLEAATYAGSDPRFGVVEAFRAPGHAAEAGVRWTRIVFWWSALQAEGPDDWNPFYFNDELLDRELQEGRRVVGLLISTPPWASTSGSVNGVPAGLHNGVDDPANLWAAFARRMAETYRGRIDDWVIWNEPDIWSPESETFTWEGSVDDFYRLQKSAYLAIKRGNPSATVALPGLTYWWDHQYGRKQYFERLLDAMAADPSAAANNWYFDVASLHLYNEPAGLFRVPRLFRSMMHSRGIDKPIWITETNVAPWDDPANPLGADSFRATLGEQASYVIQAYAAALAANVDRISMYSMSDGDTPDGADQLGLVRSDGSSRPAFEAYKTVQRYLSGASNGEMGSDGDVVQVRLTRDADNITVAWNMASSATSASIAASAPSAILADKWGNERLIEAVDGAYQVELAGATAATVPHAPTLRVIGGDPVIIIESSAPAPRPAAPPSTRLDEAPPPMPEALPPVPSKPKVAPPKSSSSSKATPTPAPKSKATATPQPTATPTPKAQATAAPRQAAPTPKPSGPTPSTKPSAPAPTSGLPRGR
jgi:hypothetical protein